MWGTWDLPKPEGSLECALIVKPKPEGGHVWLRNAAALKGLLGACLTPKRVIGALIEKSKVVPQEPLRRLDDFISDF